VSTFWPRGVPARPATPFRGTVEGKPSQNLKQEPSTPTGQLGACQGQGRRVLVRNAPRPREETRFIVSLADTPRWQVNDRAARLVARATPKPRGGLRCPRPSSRAISRSSMVTRLDGQAPATVEPAPMKIASPRPVEPGRRLKLLQAGPFKVVPGPGLDDRLHPSRGPGRGLTGAGRPLRRGVLVGQRVRSPRSWKGPVRPGLVPRPARRLLEGCRGTGA